MSMLIEQMTIISENFNREITKSVRYIEILPNFAVMNFIELWDASLNTSTYALLLINFGKRKTVSDFIEYEVQLNIFKSIAQVIVGLMVNLLFYLYFSPIFCLFIL